MKESKKYFLYVGNAYPHKNLKRLIEAVAQLNKEVAENLKLIIVSPRGVFSRRLQEEITRLNAETCVKLSGFLSDRELIPLYRGATAFVFPSLSEGFGLPGLEAMAAGTLVLASDIPVFKEIYKENALYFNPFDLMEIKEIMKNALRMDPAQRVKSIAKAQTFVKRYSWAKMGQETLRVYNSLND